MQLTCVSPSTCLEAVIQALSTIIQKVTFDEVIVASILEKGVILLQVQAITPDKEKITSVYRSLALIGYLCYFFDFEKLRTLKFRSESEVQFSKQVLDVFKSLYGQYKDSEEMQDRILESISFLWHRYSFLLSECEDMLLHSLKRNNSPNAIKRTLQMINKLFAGSKCEAVSESEDQLKPSESQISLLIPKLFENFEYYAKHKNEDVRYWSVSIIKTLSDKGYANHAKVNNNIINI